MNHGIHSILVKWDKKKITIINLLHKNLIIQIKTHFFSSNKYTFPIDISPDDMNYIRKIIEIGKRMILRNQSHTHKKIRNTQVQGRIIIFYFN